MPNFFKPLLFLLLVSACSQAPVPKPYGYRRMNFPEKTYKSVELEKYKFLIPTYATVSEKNKDWFDLKIPQLNSEINFTYFKVNNDLDALMKEAGSFTYKHQVKAEAIKTEFYMNRKKNVFGILYKLSGNVASNAQFFLTDSSQHFLRGALYFKTTPNRDSLAPAIQFVEEDIAKLIESFEWVK